jgi:hypothetical protein
MTLAIKTIIITTLIITTMTQDDAKVVELVGKYGAKKWSSIAQELKGRIGKQCRCVCVCLFGFVYEKVWVCVEGGGVCG